MVCWPINRDGKGIDDKREKGRKTEVANCYRTHDDDRIFEGGKKKRRRDGKGTHTLLRLKQPSQIWNRKKEKTDAVLVYKPGSFLLRFFDLVLFFSSLYVYCLRWSHCPSRRRPPFPLLLFSLCHHFLHYPVPRVRKTRSPSPSSPIDYR